MSDTGPRGFVLRHATQFDALLSLLAREDGYCEKRESNAEYDAAFHGAVHALKALRDLADMVANKWSPVPASVPSREAGPGTGDEFFDEDAQMCECGHIMRNHAERAWNYACCKTGCDCRGFQAAAAPLASPEKPARTMEVRVGEHGTYALEYLPAPESAAARLASLGERPDDAIDLSSPDSLRGTWGEEIATLRAELAALRSSLHEARADSERLKQDNASLRHIVAMAVGQCQLIVDDDAASCAGIRANLVLVTAAQQATVMAADRRAAPLVERET